MINYDEKYDIMYFIFEDTHGTYGDEDDNGIVLLRKAKSDDIAGMIIYDYSTRGRGYDFKHDTLHIHFAPNLDSYGEDIARGYVLFRDFENKNITGLKVFDYKKKKEDDGDKYNAPYDAKDIAKFIINHFNGKGVNISNLKLQKLLYLAWIDYYKHKKQYLFTDNFEAWAFGYVVPKVYYEYFLYAGTPIFDLYDDVAIRNDDDKKILHDILKKYIYMQPSELLELTQNCYTVWYKIYNGGIGDKKTIPFTRIIEGDIGCKNDGWC